MTRGMIRDWIRSGRIRCPACQGLMDQFPNADAFVCPDPDCQFDEIIGAPEIMDHYGVVEIEPRYGERATWDKWGTKKGDPPKEVPKLEVEERYDPHWDDGDPFQIPMQIKSQLSKDYDKILKQQMEAFQKYIWDDTWK